MKKSSIALALGVALIAFAYYRGTGKAENASASTSASGEIKWENKDIADVPVTALPDFAMKAASAAMPGGKFTGADIDAEAGHKVYAIRMLLPSGLTSEADISDTGKLIKVESLGKQ